MKKRLLFLSVLLFFFFFLSLFFSYAYFVLLLFRFLSFFLLNVSWAINVEARPAPGRQTQKCTGIPVTGIPVTW